MSTIPNRPHKLTDLETEDLLQLWGERKRREALGGFRSGLKKEETAAVPIPFPSPKGMTWRQWALYPAAISSLAACLMTAGVLLLWGAPKSEDASEWLPRSTGSGKPSGLLSDTQIAHAGWRRAGLVIGISDYSGYADPNLPDIPLAAVDAAKIQQALQQQMGASQSNIVPLINRAATEPAIRSAVHWLRQFDSPNDLILLHLAAHGRIGADGKLSILPFGQAARETDARGLPVEDLLAGLADLPGMTVLVADVCYSGMLQGRAPGPRQAIIASADSKELAMDSVFGKAWLKALTGAGDANRDGAVTLREAFDYACKAMPGNARQHPKLFLGAAMQADKVVLSLHPSVMQAFAAHGAPATAPGLLEFVPDGRTQLWLNGSWLGETETAVALVVGRGAQALRAKAVGWNDAREWSDPSPPEIPPGKVVQRAAVFPEAPEETGRGRLLAICGPGTDGHPPFPRIQGYGSPLPKAAWMDRGGVSVEFSPSGKNANSGIVLLADDAVTGVNLAILTGGSGKGALRYTVSARVENGSLPVRFFVGGRVQESLDQKISKEAVLDSDWQAVRFTVPAQSANRVVTGLGIELTGENSAHAKILIREITVEKQ